MPDVLMVINPLWIELLAIAAPHDEIDLAPRTVLTMKGFANRPRWFWKPAILEKMLADKQPHAIVHVPL